MPYPLPPGKPQFCDANGNPLAGGFVYTYVPGTTTPQATYQDYLGAAANLNPIVLDAAGRWPIFANGDVRMIVQDSLGNQQYDIVTRVASLASLGGVAKTGDTMTGPLLVPDLTVANGEGLLITPIALPLPTFVSFNAYATTISSSTKEILASFGLNNTLGAGLTGGNQNRVTLYSGHDMATGGGDGWSIQAVMALEASASTTANAFGIEVDVNNLNAHRGEGTRGAGLAAPVLYGVSVTGAGTFRGTSAYFVSGPGTSIWNRGITFAANSVTQSTYQDLSSSVTSLEVAGSHSYGLDLMNGTFSGAAIRLGNGAFLRSRDVGNTLDYAMLVQSGANMILGDASTTAIYSRNTLAAFTDNTVTCGANGNRWSAVWAANGAIQTSDPALKTDIKPLAFLGDKITQVLQGLDPIRFRWIDGGGGEPGKRQHWGWDAQQVGDVFAGIGEDFGGFVRGDDGTLHIRPDQLIPVLWQAVKDLSKRVEALEAAR